MLITAAVLPVFRALVVFLRRLVDFSGFSDSDLSLGFGLLIDLRQMYIAAACYGRAVLPDLYRRFSLGSLRLPPHVQQGIWSWRSENLISQINGFILLHDD